MKSIFQIVALFLFGVGSACAAGFLAIGRPPVSVGPITTVIVNDATWNVDPGITQFANGTLFLVNLNSTDNCNTNGNWVYRTSTNNGAAWSASTSLYVPAGNKIACDVEANLINSTTVCVAGSQQDTVTPSLGVPITFVGTVTGSSVAFGSLNTVDKSLFSGGGYTTSKPFVITSSPLLIGLPIYGVVSGDTLDSAGIVFSSDCVTWGNGVIIARATGTEQYNEANCFIEQAGDANPGRAVCILRHDAGTQGYARVTSDDITNKASSTWTAPSNVIAANSTPGRPALAYANLGRVAMWIRYNNRPAWVYSNDYAQTFMTPVTYPVGTSQQYWYGSMVLGSDNYYKTVVSFGNGSGAAELVYQDFWQ